MDRKLLALLTLFFISFGFFAFVLVFNKPITQFTRAKEGVTPSSDRSRIIGWPLNLKSDGQTETQIFVFVVSQSDRPLSNKVVTLISSLGDLKETAVVTDNNGKAVFRMSSNSPGIAEIQAIVEPNISLSKKISIKFE